MNISKKASFLLNRIWECGYEAYLVGGCIRDLLMGISPLDWDITTNATPSEIMDIFNDLHTIPTGISHGTVTVVYEGEPFEVTTYRTEGEYLDHRRPSNVSFVENLEEDLSRRDFTINAIAYAPKVGIVDPFGGRDDIERKVIRTVGLARERFSEDALRILRALRFSATLGFEIEESTFKAAAEFAYTLRNIAAERKTAEFLKLICGKESERVLKKCKDILNLNFDADGLGNLPENQVVRLAHLFSHDLDELSKFRLPKATVQSARKIAEYKYTSCPRLIRDLQHLAPLYLDLHSMPKGEYEAAIRNNVCCTISQLALDGKALAELGYEGAQIGNALESLLDAVMDSKVDNSKESLLEYLKNL